MEQQLKRTDEVADAPVSRTHVIFLVSKRDVPLARLMVDNGMINCVLKSTMQPCIVHVITDRCITSAVSEVHEVVFDCVSSFSIDHLDAARRFCRELIAARAADGGRSVLCNVFCSNEAWAVQAASAIQSSMSDHGLVVSITYFPRTPLAESSAADRQLIN